jgi:hypothetical protein
MINGKWGIGKSFYWREKIVPVIEKIKNSSTNKKYTCLYVSLNGLTDPIEIFTQLALAKLPWANSKAFKVGRSVSSLLLNVTTKIPLITTKIGDQSFDVFKSFKLEQFLDFKNNVLCFDDLERNQIQETILGFINTHFVEEYRIKTVIIGNETEIDPDKVYHRVKEKVIFRFIQFDENLIGLEEIIAKYKSNNDYYSLLKNNHAYIQNILGDYKEKNLRTLIFSLDCIKTILDFVPNLDSKFELVKSIIFISLIISFEFKSGTLVSNDYNNFKKLDKLSDEEFKQILLGKLLAKKHLASDEKPDEKESYEYEFYFKYQLNEKKEFYFFKSIYNYIISGDLNKKQLKEEEKDFYAFVEKRDRLETPQSKAFKTLQYAYWADSDDDVINAKNEFLKFIEEGDYVFYEYCVFYNLLMRLIDDKIIDEDKAEIKTLVIEGCKKAIAKVTFDLDALDYIEIKDLKAHDEELNIVIEEKIKEIKSEQKKNEIIEFFRLLSGEYAEFKRRFSWFNLFQYLPPENIFNRIQESDIKTLRNFGSYLDGIMSYGNAKDYLSFEKEIDQMKEMFITQNKSELSKLRYYHNTIVISRIENLQRSFASTL